MQYRVIPLLRSGLPNFPSTPEAYARELVKELSAQEALGYSFIGTVSKVIGRDTHEFMIYSKPEPEAKPSRNTKSAE